MEKIKLIDLTLDEIRMLLQRFEDARKNYECLEEHSKMETSREHWKENKDKFDDVLEKSRMELRSLLTELSLFERGVGVQSFDEKDAYKLINDLIYERKEN